MLTEEFLAKFIDGTIAMEVAQPLLPSGSCLQATNLQWAGWVDCAVTEPLQPTEPEAISYMQDKPVPAEVKCYMDH